MAFAAALIGGALGGFLMAFLALPAAAVIQAASQEYVKGYQVVDTELTAEEPPKPPKEHDESLARSTTICTAATPTAGLRPRRGPAAGRRRPPAPRRRPRRAAPGGQAPRPQGSPPASA